MTMGASFRDYIYQISPRWLQGRIGGALLWVFGIALDLLADKMDQGMRLHVPTYGDFSALPYLGADRLIVRGIVEDNLSYGNRLRLAWDDWGYGGQPRADLRQTLSYLLPLTPEGLTVSDQGLWNDYLAGADTTDAPAHYRVSPSNWDWDSLNVGGGARWWRCFLVLYPVSPNAFAAVGPTWGAVGPLWGDTDRSWGLSIPATEVEGLRAILAQFQGEHAWFQWMILSFDATLFRPSGAIGGVNPDGQWGRWSKVVGGQYVASRSSSARYADGVP